MLRVVEGDDDGVIEVDDDAVRERPRSWLVSRRIASRWWFPMRLLLPVHEMNPKSIPQQVNTDSEAPVSTAARSGTDVASDAEIVGAARAILVTTRRRRCAVLAGGGPRHAHRAVFRLPGRPPAASPSVPDPAPIRS